MKLVPNVFPKLHNQPYRIALIGAAPSAADDEEGTPFVGSTGAFLNATLAKCGILRDACFLGNVCQQRPPNGKLALFDWNGPEFSHGRDQLVKDLIEWRPNLCVLLGHTALRLGMGTPESIDDWRGTVFQGKYRNDHFTVPCKSMATIPPDGCLREYAYTPLLRFDLRRAANEGLSCELELPQRNLIVNLSTEEIICELEKIASEKPTISIDIEGYVNAMSCISVARSAMESFIIPFSGHGPDEPRLWKALASVLSDPTIPKILQNALYDCFILQHSYHIPVRGVVDDTMLKHWELYCELPKSLGFQTSIYTKEPFYKEDRHSESRETRHQYCCKDSAVTHEINTVLSTQLDEARYRHYRFNLALQEPILYMQLKGIAYDKQKAQTKQKEILHNVNRLQWLLNDLTGRACFTKDEWFQVCRDRMCFVKSQDRVMAPADLPLYSKSDFTLVAPEAARILSTSSPTLDIAAQGRLADITKTSLNPESPKELANYLYRELNLPIQYKKEQGRLTTTETTDVLALLTLFKKTSNPTLNIILTLRALRTRCETLGAGIDADGRIRCAYNIVGTETGRLSCYTSPTGSGFNLQTVTKKDRDLFCADSGWWLFQCDLSGADGFTVAAHCAACGDSTMLDDYAFGLKPARIIALLYTHGAIVNTWSRERIREESRAIDDDSWLYFACKRAQHGGNYGMKERTGADQILKDSYKMTGAPIYVEPVIVARLQTFYFARYPGIRLWHNQIRHQIKTFGFIISAGGHKRIFFGRRDDYNTFKQACAEEPQANTTYATNLALSRLWSDPENRIGNHLRIQPVHQVHDALIGQFRKEDTEWAKPKIREWFNNPLTIGGREVTIGFSGAYGNSWGELKEGII